MHTGEVAANRKNLTKRKKEMNKSLRADAEEFQRAMNND